MLIRILLFSSTLPDSNLRRYSPEFYPFLVLDRILPFSDIRPDSTLLWYSPEFYPSPILANILPFPVLARILLFSCTHLDSTFVGTRPDLFRYSPRFYPSSVLAQILPFSGSRPDSTFPRYWPRFLIRSQLVSQLIHVLSMVPDSGAI